MLGVKTAIKSATAQTALVMHEVPRASRVFRTGGVLSKGMLTPTNVRLA
jgi:hypothetical protein